jgi:hypothetical protein
MTPLRKLLKVARINKFGAVCSVAIACVCTYTCMSMMSQAASAGLNSVGAAVSLPQPMGDASQSLNRPLGFEVEASLDTPAPLPANLDFQVSAFYEPYSVKNLSTASLNLMGAFAGAQLWGGESVLNIRPFFSGQLGFVYDSLSFSGASSSTSNSAAAFAVKVVPGLDIPIYSHFGAVVELPVTWAFLKSTLAIWDATFGLRWKL